MGGMHTGLWAQQHPDSEPQARKSRGVGGRTGRQLGGDGRHDHRNVRPARRGRQGRAVLQPHVGRDLHSAGPVSAGCGVATWRPRAPCRAPTVSAGWQQGSASRGQVSRHSGRTSRQKRSFSPSSKWIMCVCRRDEKPLTVPLHPEGPAEAQLALNPVPRGASPSACQRRGVWWTAGHACAASAGLIVCVCDAAYEAKCNNRQASRLRLLCSGALQQTRGRCKPAARCARPRS